MKYQLPLLLLFCLGCETIVEVDAPEYSSEPVVTSFFSPEDTWSATIHRSLGVNVKRDVTLEYISDASVMVTNGSQTIDVLRYQGNGRYVSSTSVLPTDGIKYTLQVDLPDKTSIQATSSAPSPVVISDYSIKALPPPPESDPFQSTQYQIEIAFSDPPGANFYRIGVYNRRVNSPRAGFPEEIIDPDSVYSLISFETITPGWACNYSSDVELGVDPFDIGRTDLICEEFTLTDRLFDGRGYSWSGITDDVSEKTKELRLITSSLSEDYYKYLQSLDRNNLYDPALEEPFPVYSNVNGGLGVFAGYTNTKLILPIPRGN